MPGSDVCAAGLAAGARIGCGWRERRARQQPVPAERVELQRMSQERRGGGGPGRAGLPVEGAGAALVVAGEGGAGGELLGRARAAGLVGEPGERPARVGAVRSPVRGEAEQARAAVVRLAGIELEPGREQRAFIGLAREGEPRRELVEQRHRRVALSAPRVLAREEEHRRCRHPRLARALCFLECRTGLAAPPVGRQRARPEQARLGPVVARGERARRVRFDGGAGRLPGVEEVSCPRHPIASRWLWERPAGDRRQRRLERRLFALGRVVGIVAPELTPRLRRGAGLVRVLAARRQLRQRPRARPREPGAHRRALPRERRSRARLPRRAARIPGVEQRIGEERRRLHRHGATPAQRHRQAQLRRRFRWLPREQERFAAQLRPLGRELAQLSLDPRERLCRARRVAALEAGPAQLERAVSAQHRGRGRAVGRTSVLVFLFFVSVFAISSAMGVSGQ